MLEKTFVLKTFVLFCDAMNLHNLHLESVCGRKESSAQREVTHHVIIIHDNYMYQITVLFDSAHNVIHGFDSAAGTRKTLRVRKKYWKIMQLRRRVH